MCSSNRFSSLQIRIMKFKLIQISVIFLKDETTPRILTNCQLTIVAKSQRRWHTTLTTHRGTDFHVVGSHTRKLPWRISDRSGSQRGKLQVGFGHSRIFLGENDVIQFSCISTKCIYYDFCGFYLWQCWRLYLDFFLK